MQALVHKWLKKKKEKKSGRMLHRPLTLFGAVRESSADDGHGAAAIKCEFDQVAL